MPMWLLKENILQVESAFVYEIHTMEAVSQKLTKT